ncbi:MAG: CRISPR-associated protein Cas4 [Thermogutta sp.]|jgi:CRISPR-associated exonuclease Cas4
MTRHITGITPRALSEEELDLLRVNGTKVNYWAICPRKLWFFSKGITMEHTFDRVALGRLLHRESYRNLPRRDVLIDNLIRLDVLEGQEKVLEVKYSRKFSDAARLQVAYYLLYLKHLGAGDLVGELRFPRDRRREEVRLTPDLEAKLAEALRNIREIENSPRPPDVAFQSYCLRCAYAELCWG